jgi:hypothetical protein
MAEAFGICIDQTFTAVQGQLEMKFKPTKVPLDVLVIDHM